MRSRLPRFFSCRDSAALLAMLAPALLPPLAVHAQTSNAVFTTLVSFTGPNGAAPLAGLIQAKDGNLYGTTATGGAFNKGTVFRLTTAGVLTTLVSFNGSNGDKPVAALLQGQDGNFYGTTGGEYPDSFGSIFRLTPAGTLTNLRTFNPNAVTGPHDSGPHALIQVADGTFYGTTGGGSAESTYGTIFTMTTAGSYKVLRAFTDTTPTVGAYSLAPLFQASDGAFYGSTYSGGADEAGTIFRVKANGDFTNLITLSANDPRGQHPFATVFEASDGNFYGTTVDGKFYQLTPAGKYTVIHDFAAQMLNSVIQASDGFLYGTTADSIFRYDLATGAVTQFPFTDGVEPWGAPIEGKDGFLYGTTYLGGTSNDGIVYRLTLPPVLSATSPTPTTVGQPFTYQLVANRQPIGYAATGLPPGLTLDPVTGLISGTPTAAGTYTITFFVTNAAGTTTGTLTIAIALVSPPVVTSPGNATATATLPFSYQIVASGNPTGYAATGLPAGLTLDAATGLISGTPTVDGTFTITITVTNSGGTTTFTLIIIIDAALPPVVSSATSTTAQATLPFTYQIIGSSHPTGYAATGLPAGLTLDLVTGLISGTPTVDGTFTVTITVTNAFGTTTFTLVIVIDAAPSPTVTIVAFVPQVIANGGVNGVFLLILPRSLDIDLIVHYTVKGSAIAGVDYPALKGTAKIKAGKTSRQIKLIPTGDLGGASKKTVKLTLAPGDGYALSTQTSAKVKILPPGE